MKVVIAGGRDYCLSPEDYGALDALHLEHGFTEVVSGGATGADRCGEIWAQENDVDVKVFVAYWGLHGAAAGPRRNNEMARYADCVVLFPGGKGTASMKRCAEREGLDVYVIDKESVI